MAAVFSLAPRRRRYPLGSDCGEAVQPAEGRFLSPYGNAASAVRDDLEITHTEY